MAVERRVGEGLGEGLIVVGSATDTYALGCVLYETLVGQPPFTGSTPQAVLGKIITGDVPSARDDRSSVPPHVDAVIRKALEKLPADRFRGSQDFAKALVDPGFRHAEQATAGEVAGVRTWKASAIVGNGVAILLSFTLGWLLLRAEPPKPVSRFELPLPDGIAVVTNAGVGLEVSPDGSNVVFVGTSPDGGTQLWLRRLDQLSLVPIPDTEAARNPRFSPDGTSIAFTGNNSIRTVSLTGAPPRTLVSDSVPNGFGGLAWGRRTETLYFRKAGIGIWRVSVLGGEQEEVTTLAEGEGGHSWLDVLPDDRGILFTRDVGAPTEDEIAVLSLETGDIRVLFQGAMARYSHSGHLLYTSGEGTLSAVPFDPDRLEVTGPSYTLLEGVELTGGSPSYFAISETGVLVYRPAAAVLDVPVWVSRDGSEEVLNPQLAGSFQEPAISPDGRRIAFAHAPVGGTRDIWIYDIEQGTFERLTNEGTNRSPFWSPDGGEVGFSSEREGIMALYSRSANLSGEARLLVAGRGQGLVRAGWTPGGRSLVFQQGQNSPVIDLLYATPDSGSTPVEFLATPFVESDPSLSPDGRWLAHQSNESGRREVYVRPFPGPGGRILVSVNGGALPVWTRNGREILYVANGRLAGATVRTEPDFALESREVLFDWGPYRRQISQHYDASPDGQRLLAIRATPASGGRVRDVVVQNVFEELRARMGN